MWIAAPIPDMPAPITATLTSRSLMGGILSGDWLAGQGRAVT